MNAQQLLSIALRANQLKKEDFNDLLKFQQAFPYFQLPAILLAKYEFDHSHGEKNFLATAAIGSPNRSWLKNLLRNPESWEQFNQNFSESLMHQITTKKTSAEIHLNANLESHHPLPSQEKRMEEKITYDTDEEAPVGRIRRKRVVQDEDLIETIRKREKKEIKDDKKKEQIDIIQEFNKKGIKLATIREIESNYKQADLSEKSTTINDSLITESLAKLFVKQNKKAKAREIYQKLIVKFPEKSTYFADQIKNLEEN